MPVSMRAIRQQTLGGPEVLELVDVPRPEPGPTEVLVRVTAAGVNPVDWKTRARGAFLGEPPFTLGWDVAGVVEELGLGVTRFEVGARVFGMPRFPHEAGAYAEYVTSPSRHLQWIPEDLTDVEAAALPLAGLTAWQALTDAADVNYEDRVLILGAAGGVGHLAVQIAKEKEAYVIATASAPKHAFLTELGADEVIDYTTERVEERVRRRVGWVIDLVGDESSVDSLECLVDGGTFVVIPSASRLEALREAAADRVQVRHMLVEPDEGGLVALWLSVRTGKLRPHVERTFPLERAAEAHRLGEQGHTTGKLVLVP
jgi:NADPH:quinone reductase-like Zn-dependent oxidoreductase